MNKVTKQKTFMLFRQGWTNSEIAQVLNLSEEEIPALDIIKDVLAISKEGNIAGIFPHVVIYSLDELKQIGKTGEAFRKYLKNPYFVLNEIKPYLESISNDIEVSNLGHIKINGNIVSPFEKEKKGYFYVNLEDKIDYLVDRLVAETWCEFFSEKTDGWYVHHIIDGDGSDNRADNLVWCDGTVHLQGQSDTPQGDISNGSKSMSKDKWLTDLSVKELQARFLQNIFEPIEIDGILVFMHMEKRLLSEEVFRKHPKLPVEVSNLGRIKFNGDILLQRPDPERSDPYGYLWVEIPRVSKYKLVYRLVAETWCDRPDPFLYTMVHHISNNSMDNRPENLLWVTPDQLAEIYPEIVG
jgi:hypothetical protein